MTDSCYESRMAKPVDHFGFWGRCAAKAAEGSFQRANAVAPVVGGFVTAGVAWLLRLTTDAPTSIVGALWFTAGWGVFGIGTVWVVIFLYRLALAPSRLYYAELRHSAKFERELRLAKERPASNMALSYNYSERYYPKEPLGLASHPVVAIQNISDQTLTECQLQLNITNIEKGTRSVTFNATDRFILRPKEIVEREIASLSIDHKLSYALLKLYRETASGWVEAVNHPGYAPGAYQVDVQALAVGTVPCSLTLFLIWAESGWQLHNREDAEVSGLLAQPDGDISERDRRNLMFTWDDIVIVTEAAPKHLRPGSRAWIVGVSGEDQRSGSYREQFPTGTVYTIEFEDGSDAQAHESVLRRAPD